MNDTHRSLTKFIHATTDDKNAAHAMGWHVYSTPNRSLKLLKFVGTWLENGVYAYPAIPVIQAIMHHWDILVSMLFTYIGNLFG